VPLRLTIPIY